MKLKIIFLLLLVSVSKNMHGNIFHVPSNYVTIANALLACQQNDTVLVDAGVYHENIIWPSTQGIKLLSSTGPISTIIDGSLAGQVISITGNSLADSQIVI